MPNGSGTHVVTNTGQLTTARREFEADFDRPNIPVVRETAPTLQRQIEESAAHLYDAPRDVPNNLLTQAVDRVKLGLLGDSSQWDEAVHDIVQATRTNERLKESFRPHTDWGEVTYYDIFVADAALPPRQYEKGNHETHDSQLSTASEAATEAARMSRRTELVSAVHSALVDKAGKIFDQATTASTDTPEARQGLYEIVTLVDAEEVAVKTTPAREAFEKALGLTDNDPMKRKSLLNLALDMSVSAMDTLPDTPSASHGETYLTAARSLFDLTSEPDSFRPHLSEREAREFRTRAYEMATFWLQQAETAYNESLDITIGNITPDRLNEVRHQLEQTDVTLRRLQEIAWFTNIFRDKLEESEKYLQGTPRSLGSKAIIHALKQPTPPTELVPPADAPMARAA